MEAAVARALSERTDVQQSLNNLKISDINLQNQVDETKPQLNLTSNYGLTGLGGPTTSSVRDPITGRSLSQTHPLGYLDALRNIVGFDVPQWTVGVNFAYPLGKSAQEATVARSKLSLDQTQANLKALQLQIATDVANAALTVQSSLESGAGLADGARARAGAAQRDAEQVRGRHVDQLRGRPGAARFPRRAEQRAPRPPQLPEGARELRNRPDGRHARRRAAVGGGGGL